MAGLWRRGTREEGIELGAMAADAGVVHPAAAHARGKHAGVRGFIGGEGSEGEGEEHEVLYRGGRLFLGFAIVVVVHAPPGDERVECDVPHPGQARPVDGVSDGHFRDCVIRPLGVAQ